MIELIKNENDIFSFENDDLFSIRIKSLLSAYETKYNFARFYVQKIDDNITAIISVLDNDVTLSYKENIDDEEIIEFLITINYSSLLCDEGFNYKDKKYTEGVVMTSSKLIDNEIPYTTIDEYPPLMELFNFIDYDNQDFESWYVDINHRIRHNCAKAYSLNVNDEIISSGILSSIYNDFAILTSVRTKAEFRKMGYGSALISAMMADFSKTIYLMREKNINKDFYKKLGFIETGYWRIYK